MANRNTRMNIEDGNDGHFLVNQNGSAYSYISREGSPYAVIVRCGHCGDGYYVPIMFTTNAPNIEKAIEDVTMYPRVKRDLKNCVIDAFEITPLEKDFIEYVKNRDLYLKYEGEDECSEAIERRILLPGVLKDMVENGVYDYIRLAESYAYDQVLERAFAPRVMGSDFVIPDRIRKEELLDEFFRCFTIKYGVIGNSPKPLLFYYLKYGKGNEFGISLQGDVISIRYEDVSKEHVLLPETIKYIEKHGLPEDVEEREEYYSGKVSKQKSALERFNDRQHKSQRKIKKSMPNVAENPNQKTNE